MARVRGPGPSDIIAKQRGLNSACFLKFCKAWHNKLKSQKQKWAQALGKKKPGVPDNSGADAFAYVAENYTGEQENNLCFTGVGVVATLAKLSEWLCQLSLTVMETWSLVWLMGKAGWLCCHPLAWSKEHQPALISCSGDWHLCATFPFFPCPQAGHREPPLGPYQTKPLTISYLYNLIPLLQKHRKSTEAMPQIIPQELLNHLINSYDPFKWRRPDDRALLSACFKV